MTLDQGYQAGYLLHLPLLQIKTLLVKLARDSCISALGSLQERISMLQERPTELDMFMAYQVTELET